MSNETKKIFDKNFEQLSKLYKIAQGNRSLVQFASDAGISAGNLSRILRGQVASPGTLKRLADCSPGISYEELMVAAGYLEPPSGLSVEEPEAEVIRSKSVADVNEGPLIDYGRSIAVPIVNRFHPHCSTLSRENVSSILSFPESFMGQGDFIIYVVTDDYFAPRIRKGDMVLVDVKRKPAPGDIALVRINRGEQPVLRRFTIDLSRVILYGQAGNVRPEAYPKSKVEFVGIVIKAFINSFE